MTSMTPRVNPRVLCVDDEPEVLEGIKQNLRRSYNLHLASSAEQAIDMMKAKSFAVVISDMRMPGMDGAQLLRESRGLAPNAVRILLTGQCDIESAKAAVNQGQIFRFLSKPCATNELKTVISEAIHLYELATVEKDLLQRTLKGSIKLLTDALAITSPLAFGRAKSLHKRVSTVAQALNLAEPWNLEIASMLSQLGAISLDDETLKKLYVGEDLNDHETQMVAQMPGLTRQLLSNIPRLEKVVLLLEELHKSQGRSIASSLSIPGQVLGFAIDLEEVMAQGADITVAIDLIGNKHPEFNEKVIDAFRECFSSKDSKETVVDISPGSIKEGMIIAQDVYTSAGALLVVRGFEVTASFALKLKSFRKGYLKEPLRVVMPEKSHENES